MVFENTVLFLQDALVMHKFTDVIKAGDSGRIVTCLKVFALMYQGMGCTKYMHEVLHLMYNLVHVWPAALL